MEKKHGVPTNVNPPLPPKNENHMIKESLYNIEERLKAIRGIAERKESIEATLVNVDKALEDLRGFESSSVKFTGMMADYRFDLVPREIQRSMLIIIRDHYADKRDQLIKEASELMK